MTIELCMLLGVTAVLFVSILIQASVTIPIVGLKAALGNREDAPASFPGLAGRAQRTVGNHITGLVLFMPLVLTAAIMGVSNEMTVLGAQVYFYSRVAHALLYIVGISYIRSLAWGIGLFGLLAFAKGAFF